MNDCDMKSIGPEDIVKAIQKVVVRRYSFGHEGIYAGNNQSDAIESRPQGDIEPVYFWKLEQDFVYLNDPIIPELDKEILIGRIRQSINLGRHKTNDSYTTVVWESEYGIALYEYCFNLELGVRE